MPNNSNPSIAVLGAGSWGTTLALVLHGKGFPVRLWEFRKEAAIRLQQDKENREFLPGIPLPVSMSIHHDAVECLQGANVVLLAIPSQFVRSAMERMVDYFPTNALIVNAAKGIEEDTLKRSSEVVADLFPHVLPNQYAALSGPSHAEEVSRGIPTSVVAASPSLDTARTVQELFYTPSFRVYASQDLIGVELGAALKNVIAIGTGISDGLGFGDNTKGALLTRGLAEMTRLGVKLGGQPRTFAGLSGMGDLITTCMSSHSRNRYVGEQVGKGKTLEEVEAGMSMIAEGVCTTRSTYQLSRRENVPMPICEAAYTVLFEDKDPKQAVIDLMTRELKVED
ncbi:glycerol-3-phosphate dehydrogenase [candidate division LCP-89 bacterium B3_LCP]|uniref:Glycerol-3-phosphate dehydrogenase [NAD(P)+] n=1 Tax=candidate division LCP-89 bacterium B3_LCP TaxID=2012998 RepID=A0A532V4K9_UNCL8|nr:MAG: glycerol-3-phosphate dehydrogenase [candidate division LCP-89 bacterium B3_LCP]